MKKGYPIEIFKPGIHTTMHGETISFTEEDLAATAKAYDPKVFESPFVVGHPKVNAPAYGWVSALDFSEGLLLAQGQQVEPQFAELVRDGRFKKVSARFFRPDAPDNPVPGVWYLHHVGFLGAAAPAVKGLKSVSFAAGEAGCVTVEFGESDDWTMRGIASLFRRIREKFIEKFGSEEADQTLPNWQIEELEDAARRRMAAEPPPVFSQLTAKEETDVATKEELEKKEQDLKDREASFSERERKLKEKEDAASAKTAETRKAEAAAFCEELVKAGKLLPAHKGRMAAFVAGLSAETTVEFGEGDGKKTESQLAAFKAFAASLPVVVQFGEVALAALGDPPPAGAKEASFAAADLTSKV